MLGNQGTSPSLDAKLEVLHDHYKDSFAHCTEHRKQRDRFLVFILIVVSLQLFQVFSPASAETAIGEFAAKKMELSSPVDVSFIKSIIWFALLGLSMRYYQSCISLERQYAYIHKVEETLCTIFQGEAFTREGKSYLSNYPIFSDWTHIIYTWSFPLLLVGIVVAKIYNEITTTAEFSVLLGLNAVFAFSISVSTFLYLLTVHPVKHRPGAGKNKTEPETNTKQSNMMNFFRSIIYRLLQIAHFKIYGPVADFVWRVRYRGKPAGR